jgi:hypothetical protein
LLELFESRSVNPRHARQIVKPAEAPLGATFHYGLRGR